MIPIQDLLHRIQWDPEFGKSEFVVGYLDKVAGRVVRVPFVRLSLTRGERFTFDAVESDGSVHMVPFHRVREIWRDGMLIWARTRESSTQQAAGDH
jgi:uncharacterized protein (UPF0248 family)